MMDDASEPAMRADIARRRPAGRFDLWFVPALLVLIALGQQIQAHTGTLSPWKGGGFGMFATMDAPGLRFFTVEAVDTDGAPCVVSVPFKGIGDAGPFTSGMGRYQKVIPTRRGLEKIGSLLLEAELIPSASNRRGAVMEFIRQNPGANDALVQNIDDDLIVFRPKRPTDVVAEGTPIIRLRSVRLQSWKMRFDSGDSRLWAEPLGEAVELGDLS